MREGKEGKWAREQLFLCGHTYMFVHVAPHLQFSLFSWWILTYCSRLASWAYYLFLTQFIHVSIITLIWHYSCLLICFPFELLSADKIFYSIFVSLVPFPVHILNYHVTDVKDFFWSKSWSYIIHLNKI